MEVPDNQAAQRFFHGTRANLKPGDLIEAGYHSNYGQRKKELLIRNDAQELVRSYNGLAETAYIARLAQEIVALEFGWGLQTQACPVRHGHPAEKRSPVCK